MLEIKTNRYSAAPRADADLGRSGTALVNVADRVFAIGGSSNKLFLRSVSCHNLTTNTWIVNLP